MRYQGVVAFLKKNNASKMHFIKEPNKNSVYFKLNNREKTTGLIEKKLQSRILAGKTLSIDSVAVAAIPDKELGIDKYELRYMGVNTHIEYVIFDTETVGLPKDFNAPSSDIDNWPRMIQLSWINIDKDGNTIKENNHIIYPDGFIIPEHISSLTGITNELAKAKGEHIEQVLEAFIDDVKSAKAIIGHNVSFDISVVGAELIRLGKEDTIKSKPSICTMKSTVDYCAIPGRNGYKYPKLQDLYKKLFGKEFDDAHNALSDTRATQKCFIELKTRGVIHKDYSIKEYNPEFMRDKEMNKVTKEPNREIDETDFEVDGIKLDHDNPEFQLALQFALESNRNLYLTGKAGSGKTTFLKYLQKVAKAQEKEIAIVAPTGVAAINAGGQTIHSFFKIAPSIYVPGDKRLRVKAPASDSDKSTVFDYFRYSRDRINMMKSLDILVIDEVSMVRSDLLDVVDTLLRIYRNNNNPFGGVHTILIGDTFQLPPVALGEEKDLLYRFYDSEFFFSAKVIQRSKPLYIELKKIYRQNEKDFIDLLNRVRVGQMIPDDFRALNAKLNPWFHPGEKDNYITLATTINTVANVNDRKLDELKTPLITYMAVIEGDFPLSSRPTDTELRLKVGAQVMFVKNNWEKRYYNGKIGVVIELKEDEVKVEVEADHGERKIITAQREEWQNKIYSWDDKEKRIVEKVIGTFTQFPLRLAWAITVHKSQGLTFEKVIADIGDSFASGQAYVALSRCTTMNGLVLTSPINQWTVKTDKRVIDFAKNETPETLLTEQLSGSKADYYYSEARKAFHIRKVGDMLDNFFTAIKYRNDISTDTFRHYVSTWLTRFFGIERDNVELMKQVKEKEEEILVQSNALSDLRNQIFSLKLLVKSKESIIDQKDNELSSAQESLETKDSDIAQLQSEISENRELLVSKDKELKQYDLRVRLKNYRIRNLENIVYEQKKEIARISSITWYQKLFGKK